MMAAADDPSARIAVGHQLAWGRPPAPDELDRALRFVRDAAAVSADRDAWTSLARVLLTANEFLYID